MTRVVVALAAIPHPDGTAAAKCSLALLRGLGAHGVEVVAVAPRRPGDQLSPPGDVAVELVDVPAEEGWSARVGEIARPRGHLASTAFGARVRELARDAGLVYCDEVDAARVGRALAVPSICHLHYAIGADRDPAPPWTKPGREWIAFRRTERWATRHADHLVFSSPEVADQLGRRDGRDRVIRMPLAVNDYPPSSQTDPVAGIIGTASWPPTERAMHRLAVELWPRLIADTPGARLLVAGRGTDGLGISGPGIDVRGRVGSAAEFVAGLGLLLFPIVRGSGVKVKVLEALASGVPVVTTPAGAEGCEPNDGLIVVDDDDSFVEAANRLLADPGERQKRGRAAREAMFRAHDATVAVAPLVEWFRLVATG